MANGMSIVSAVFVWVAKAMLYNALSTGEENLPKLPPAPWDFVTLPEEDRATARGDMHRENRKDRACSSGDIFADRQTHTDVLIAILCHRPSEQSDKGKLEMWANAQRDGRPAEYRWRSLFNAADYYRVQCSNAAKTRNPLKFAGCPKLPNRSQPLVGRSSP